MADREEREDKAAGAFRTISEVADSLGLPQHVLRFWESQFPVLKPLKLKGGRRYYRPQDVETVSLIQELLYKQGYTIRGARKALAQARRRDANNPSGDDETMPKNARPAAPLEDTPLFQMLRKQEAGSLIMAAVGGAAEIALPVSAASSTEAVAPVRAPKKPAGHEALVVLRGELLALKAKLGALPIPA